MASAGLQQLSSLLPGGTFITFTVLVQVTTNNTGMAQREQSCGTRCSDARYICGAGYYEVTIALVAVTTWIVAVLGWYGASLPSVDSAGTPPAGTPPAGTPPASQAPVDRPETHEAHTQTGSGDVTPSGGSASLAPAAAAAAADAAASAARRDQEAESSARAGGGLTRPAGSSEIELHGERLLDPAQKNEHQRLRNMLTRIVRSVGGACIFLVLALMTPPSSTCLNPGLPQPVIQAVPLLVSFFVSAVLVVMDRVIDEAVWFYERGWKGSMACGKVLQRAATSVLKRAATSIARHRHPPVVHRSDTV